MIWLTLETTEGNWQIQQFYGMRPGGDTVTRRPRLTSNGEEETLLRSGDLRTPCPEPLEHSPLEAPGYPAVLHQQLDRLPAGQWSELDRGDLQSPRPTGVHGNSNLLVWGFYKDPFAYVCELRRLWVTQRLWFGVYDCVQGRQWPVELEKGVYRFLCGV